MCLTHRVYINGMERVIPGGTLSYAELVRCAGLTGTPSATYYWRGKGDHIRHGTMYGDKVVELDDDMQFSVVHTGCA